MKRLLCGLTGLWLYLSLTGQATAQYAYTPLNVPGSTHTFAAGINTLGQIVGTYVDADGKNHGFLWSGSSYTTLDVPGASLTGAGGINATGQIVGSYVDAGDKSHGFLLDGGTYTTIDVPGAVHTVAASINDARQVVGQYDDASGTHGFLLTGGSYTTLNAPGAVFGTMAFGINASGQIVGQYIGAGYTEHGFLLRDGTYTTLDPPGTFFGAGATGINATGQIVGSTIDAQGTQHGFLLSGGNYLRLDVPGTSATVPFGINDSGQIVGSGFLATPISELAWHGPTLLATGVAGNPSFVQAKPGTYGGKGNYELVVPLQGGGIGHFERNNDDPNLPWSGPVAFATDQGAVDAVSIIQSNFSTAGSGPGNLAVVARIGNALVYFYRDDTAPFAWHGPEPISLGVRGVPSFVQALPGAAGTKGNYELVVPLESGGIGHFYRNNDDENLTWHGPVTFGAELGSVDAVSLIQSNFSTAGSGPGNLAVVARVGNALVYFYRDDLDPFAWHGPVPIFTGVSGNPSFVQDRQDTYGTKGNYELVVPLPSGGIGHFYRNNDDPTLPWSGPLVFATDQDAVDGVSLVQSNFSTAGSGPGNLAVVSVTANALGYFYRDD